MRLLVRIYGWHLPLLVILGALQGISIYRSWGPARTLIDFFILTQIGVIRLPYVTPKYFFK